MIYTVLAALLLAAAVFWIMPAVLRYTANNYAADNAAGGTVARVVLETAPSPSSSPSATPGVERIAQAQTPEPAQAEAADAQTTAASLSAAPTQEPQEIGELEEENIAAGALDSVVSIVGVRKQEDDLAAALGLYNEKYETFRSTGILFSADGYIVTQGGSASADAKYIYVELAGGKRVLAERVGEDKLTGVLVLKVEQGALPEEAYLPADLNESAGLVMGDSLGIVADPSGNALSPVFYQGAVNAPDAYFNFDGEDFRLVSTDVAYEASMAGAPAISAAGEIVGVVCDAGAWADGEDSGNAAILPLESVVPVVERLIAEEEIARPGVGVALLYVGEETARQYEAKEGLYVSKVYENSAAERYGLREGDIIVAIDGEPCKTTECLFAACSEKQPGDKLALTIWRGGRERELGITLMGYNL